MPDISKITLPSGTTYDIKDATARELISGGISFQIAWSSSDYSSASAPSSSKLATVPAGVVVYYNNGNGTATGTLTASEDTKAVFYLIYSKSQVGNKDMYDEVVTVEVPGTPKTYFWEKIGDTQIDLNDVVTGVTLTKGTDSVIGADATFTITQPTVALSTGATAGTGVISVATGITSANATGGNVAWNSKDQVTALTGVKVTAQPTVSLTANAADSTGRITYVESRAADTTKKLVTTSITGVSGSTTPNVVQGRTSQTTANGAGTASSVNTDWLKGVSVSDETLVIGAATLNTQTTYSANAPGTITVPTAASSATTVATGSVANSDSSGATVVTAVGANTTKYMSASASGTAVGADGTDTVIGSNSTFTITQPTITVTPTTTNIKAIASGANTAWNSKDQVTVVTDAGTSITVTKGGASN